MESLGKYLREEREKRGVSLEDVHQRTKISLRVLAALESGDTSALPPRVVLRGFLKSYGEVVGLDPEEVEAHYQQAGELAPKPLTSVRSVPEPKRPNFVLVALVVVALIAGGAVLLRTRSDEAPAPLVPSPAPAPMPEVFPAEVPPLAEVAPATPAAPATKAEAQAERKSELRPMPAPVAKPEATRPAPRSVPSPAEKLAPDFLMRAGLAEPAESAAAHVLRAEALERTWLRLTRDDGPAREYLLRAGEKVSWKATERFKLTVGNAAGIELTLDGAPVGPLGELGQVVSLTLPRPQSAANTGAGTPH